MALPGFKTSMTTQGTILESAIQLLFSRLEQIYPLKRLDDVASISSGGTPSRQNSSFYGGDIPWAKISDITSAGKWISQTEETITEDALKQSSAQLFPVGTVFFSMYGSIGKTSIAKRSIATNQAILGLISDEVPSEYLYYALINARVRLFSQSKGTSQKNINGGMVKAFKIPLPPADEQVKIIEYLSLVEEGKSTNEIQNLSEYLKETSHIVERIEAFAVRIAKAQALRKQASDEAGVLFASESYKLFSDIKKKYETKSFGSFSPHVTSGPRYWRDRYSDIGHRFYRAQDIGSRGNILPDSKAYVTPPDSDQGKTALLEHGDLMIVITGATVGRCAIYTEDLEPGYVSQHVSICRLPQDKVLPRYALLWLLSPDGQQQLLGQRYGQGKPGLNLTNIRSIVIPVPPLDEQRRNVAYLDSVQARLASLRELQSATGEELSALLPSVLDRAFKGEL